MSHFFRTTMLTASVALLPLACAGRTSLDDSVALSGESLCNLPVPEASDSRCNFPIDDTTIDSVTLWIDDGFGGVSYTIHPQESLLAGGHTYAFRGGSIILGNNVAAAFAFDIDGTADALKLTIAGCGTNNGNNTWSFDASLARESLACPDCKVDIARHYTFVGPTNGARTSYKVTADGPPRGCGLGLDVVAFTTVP